MIIPSQGFPVGGTVTNQNAQITFDSVDATVGVPRNFGLNTQTTVTTPSTNNFNTVVSLGTTTVAIDGLYIGFSESSGRVGVFRLSIDGGTTWCVQNHPFNAVGPTIDLIRLPIRIAAGKTIHISMATNAGATFTVFTQPYQSNVTSTITRLEGLGTYTSPLVQGVAITAATTWTPFSATTAAAKGVSYAFVGPNNDTGRTSGTFQYGVATGASGSESIFIPNIIGRENTNNVMCRSMGPIWTDIPVGTVFSMRVTRLDATFADSYSGQLVLMYEV